MNKQCNYLSVAQIPASGTKHDDVIKKKMETFSALLAICAGNSPVTGELPTQRPVTRSFDVFFDLRLNKRFSTLVRLVICDAIAPIMTSL